MSSATHTLDVWIGATDKQLTAIEDRITALEAGDLPCPHGPDGLTAKVADLETEKTEAADIITDLRERLADRDEPSYADLQGLVQSTSAENVRLRKQVADIEKQLAERLTLDQMRELADGREGRDATTNRPELMFRGCPDHTDGAVHMRCKRCEIVAECNAEYQRKRKAKKSGS
jgi:hypothetical protein